MDRKLTLRFDLADLIWLEKGKIEERKISYLLNSTFEKSVFVPVEMAEWEHSKILFIALSLTLVFKSLNQIYFFAKWKNL